MDAPAILVVEDDRDLRDLMELALTDVGYRVVTAGDGREALARVAREMPSLILLDMKMPVMSGWEFATTFRGQYDRAVPIVVVTAAHDAVRRAAGIGADAHLDKPFDLEELFAVVARFVPPA